MIEISLGDLQKHELKFAAGLLGRAFRDSPMIRVCVRGDAHRRMLGAQRGFGLVVALMERPPLVARRGEWLAGICGIAPPGTCRMPLSKGLRLISGAMLFPGPLALARYMRVILEWERRDPEERHWHLGPVGVEPALQGMSVGSQMIERFCAEVDDQGELAWLETDKPENVRLYERFGFVVTDQADIIGMHCWFMRREPRTGDTAGGKGRIYQ